MYRIIESRDKEKVLYKDVIFEICYATPDMRWWTDVTPDFRKSKWRKVSDLYDESGYERN